MLDRASRVFLFLTLGVPLYLAPGFLFPFVSVRGLIFRALVAAAGVCVLLRALVSERVERGDRDWTLAALAGLLAVSVLSGVFGFSWQRSVFGTLARLGGVSTLVHLLLLYVLLRVAFNERAWRAYLRGVVFVGLLAAAYGLLQRYQVELGIVWEGAPIPPNGPLGNYGIFGGYLVFPIGVAAYLFAAEKAERWRYSAAACLIPLLWVLWLTTNRSSLLGLLCGTIVGLAAYGWYLGRWRSYGIASVLAGITVVAFVGSMRPGQPFADLGPRMPPTLQRFLSVAPTDVGADRRIQWRAALLAAKDRPLLGYGPENHEIVWAKHFDPAIYAMSEDQFWDRTHNAYFEALGTTGIVGLISLLLLWIAMLATIESKRRQGSLSHAEAAVLIGLNIAYAAYLWFWFFDLTAMAVWIALAAYVASRGRRPPVLLLGARAWRAQSVGIAVGTVIVGGVLTWTHAVSPLIEARRLGHLQGVTDSRAPDARATTLREFRGQLASVSPYAVSGTALFSRYLSMLRPAFPVLRGDSAFVRELAPTLEQSLIAVERARAADPHNDRLMTVKTRIMIRASQFYGSPEIADRAEATAREAVALGPRRVGPRLILAGLLAAAGRNTEAMAAADSALLIYPRSPDAHGVRASIFLAAGRPDSAAAELVAAMPAMDTSAFAGPETPRTDPELVLRVASVLVDSGNVRVAADLLRHYMRRWYGDIANWRRGSVKSLAMVRLDRTIASMIPALELRSQDTTASSVAARGFAAICGPSRHAVNEFLRSLDNPRGAMTAYPRSIASGSEDLAVIVADVTRLCEPRAVR